MPHKVRLFSLIAALISAAMVFSPASVASADSQLSAQSQLATEEGEELLDPQPIGSCGLSDFMQDSASATYHSLVSRIDGHGMAPTSLTGLYPDGLMYLRDASAQVLAMLAANDAERAEPLLRYILQYPLASGFERDGAQTFPHRVPALSHVQTFAPLRGQSPAVPSISGDILTLTIPSTRAGSTGQLTKIDVPISSVSGLRGSLEMRVISHEEAPSQVAAVDIELGETPRWVTFELSPPGYGPGKAPDELRVIISPKDTPEDAIDAALEDNASSTPSGEGALRWHGHTETTPLFRAYTADMRITDSLNGNNQYPLGDGRTWDEMDENMHVFYAWASYVEHTGDVHFLRDTWPAVQRLMDFYLSRSWYWLEGSPATSSNLLRNPRLDAVEYHDGVYDLVTNVFASAAFASFGRISSDPLFQGILPETYSRDSDSRWTALGDAIDRGINEHLVVTERGTSFYVPWLTPQKKPDLGIGSIWVSLVPLAIDWNGFDAQVMRGTVARYHEQNSFNFGGVRMLNARYAEGARPGVGTQKNYTGQWILLKALTWEVQFERSQGNAERMEQIALWVGNYFPSTRVPAPESWIVNYAREVPVRDGGNQEHSSWYIHGLLQSFPGCATEILHQSTQYSPPPRVGTFTPIDFVRHAGTDRTHTSVLAARSTIGVNRTGSVYLARGDNYADAISGGALRDGPIILLPGSSSLNTEVRQVLRDLRPERVVALGGPAVVSQAALAEAGRITGSRTQRLSGSDRFTTAAAIAHESFSQASSQGSPNTTVYLADGIGADGKGSPDAVSAGALTDGATLLINPSSNTLPAATKKALEQLKPSRVIALGGSAVVSDRLLAQAKSAAKAGTSSRLAGADRYATSVAIAQHAAKYHAREVILVRGDELADSVTAGGLNRGPILLTPSRTLAPAVTREIKRLRPWKITVLGGSAVVSDHVVGVATLEAVKPG